MFKAFADKQSLILTARFEAVETHKNWRCFKWVCTFHNAQNDYKYTFDYRAGLAHQREAKRLEHGEGIPGNIELAKARLGHGVRITLADEEARVMPIAPSLADVLSSLQNDCQAGAFLLFEDYCAEYGENADSRATERTWRQCQEVRGHMQKLLGSAFDEFMRLQEE